MSKLLTFKVARTLLGVAAALSLAACVTEPVASTEPDPMTQSSVIAVSSPDIELNSTHQLSWFPQDFLVIEGASPSAQNIESYNNIKEKLRVGLEAKGFKFAPDGVATDRQVVVAAMLGGGENVENMESLFKLYPNLNSSEDFKTGTLLVAVIDPAQFKAAWRAAIQMLIDEEVSPQQRQQRVDIAVQRLLHSLSL